MSFRQDLSQTFRSLRKAPGFSFIVIVTLALGIAANTAVFSVIHVVLLRPLPFPDSAHLLRLFEAKTPNDSATRSGVSPGNFIDWQEQNRAFTNLAAAQSFHYNLTGDGPPEHVWGGAVSAAWFAVLGVQPLLGRDFRLDEDGPAGAPVVILSEQIWRRRYLADTEIIGKTIGVNGDSFTVIGVMPAKADYREDIELWIPLHRQIRPDRMLWRDSRFLHVLARARPGVTLRQAADDLNRIAADVTAAHPTGDIYGAATIERLQEVLTNDVQGMLLVSLATVALVLLVASANIAILMLLRTTGRTRELAIRMALGARVGSLLRQLVLEGMCLSALGGMLGLGAGVAGKKLLLQLLSWGSPELDAIDLGWPVLIFNFGVSLAAGVLFALVPAVAVLRGEMQDVLNRASFVTAGGTKGRRLRQGFVIAEIACSLVLLAGAGLLIRSFQVLRHVSLGFSTDHRAVALISLPRTRYQNDIDVVQFFQKVGDRVRALPEVEDATITYPLPLFDGGFGSSFQLIQQAAPAEQFYNVDLRLVDSHSFSTLSVPLLRGRTIADSDHSDSEPVCVINRAMAQRYWPGQEPLGQLIVLTRLDVSGARRPRRIVGVVGNVRDRVNEEPQPALYVPYAQMSFFSMQLLVHSRDSVASVRQSVASVLRTIDPDQPLRSVDDYGSFLPNALTDWRNAIALLGGLAGLAVLLTISGVFAVVSCAVRERTREIGIRMAIGATRGNIRNLILRQTAWLAALGAAIGIAAAAFSTRLLGSLIYEVRPTDPLAFMFATIILGAISLVASYIPTKTAMSVDPMLALRDE